MKYIDSYKIKAKKMVKDILQNTNQMKVILTTFISYFRAEYYQKLERNCISTESQSLKTHKTKTDRTERRNGHMYIYY